MTAMDDCPRCKVLREEALTDMTEAAQLARTLHDNTNLTWIECALVADGMSVADERYRAVATWCRVAAREGTVDLDRTAANQDLRSEAS